MRISGHTPSFHGSFLLVGVATSARLDKPSLLSAVMYEPQDDYAGYMLLTAKLNRLLLAMRKIHFETHPPPP